MGSLDIQNLFKEYGEGEGKVLAVDNLDITIDDGEFLVLVGPSGCGKSTTLRCIAGLEQLTDGEIYLDGEPISDRKPKDRNNAMVFQNYALYPHMTARGNMSFGLKMTTDLSRDEIDERIEDVAAMMGISDLLDSKPSELSGGQQQRVALGRAIVRDPEIFLMDEPLSNLDAKLRAGMRTELQQLQDDLQVTTVYVTHDQTEAMTMGDRIAVLDGGELQQIGTPLECYHQPNNKFVAGFIGSPSMNFLDVRREENVLEHPAFEYEMSNELSGHLDGLEKEFVLGIRPEDIKLVDQSGLNRISTSVNVIEPMGDFSHLYLDIGGKQITATVPGDVQIQAGSNIEITFPEERIHLFKASSGEAVKHSEVSFEGREEKVLTS